MPRNSRLPFNLPFTAFFRSKSRYPRNEGNGSFLYLLNAVDKLLHTLGACLFHRLGHVAVDVEREPGSMVPKILLQRFYIVTALECGYSVAVAQVVETGFLHPQLLYNSFVVAVDRLALVVST